MDPNAALKRIRAIVEESNRTGMIPTPDEAEELVELLTALDAWLSNGGFLPKAWER